MSVEDVERPRRRKLRQRQQELSRSLILDAAETVFGRKGYHEATLREVAELAEFSVGSIYSFFAGKEDLFAQLFLRRGTEFRSRMQEILSPDTSVAGSPEGATVRATVRATEGSSPLGYPEGSSPLEQLAELVAFQVGFFRAHRDFSRVYLHHANAGLQFDDPEIGALLNANTAEALAMQAELIRRGQHHGEIRAGDPAVLARLFSGIVSAFQAVDPAVMSDDESAVEVFGLDELQAFVRSAFAAA